MIAFYRVECAPKKDVTRAQEQLAKAQARERAREIDRRTREVSGGG